MTRRWYPGRDLGSPPDNDVHDARCDCGEVLWTREEREHGECRDCHRANDESERWIDSSSKRTGTD